MAAASPETHYPADDRELALETSRSAGRAYDLRVRKWLIFAGASVLAAAVVVTTVWAVTGSESRRTFKSPFEAVAAICGPGLTGIDNAFFGGRDNTYNVGKDGVAQIILPRPDRSGLGAVVKGTRDGKFTVEDCNLRLPG